MTMPITPSTSSELAPPPTWNGELRPISQSDPMDKYMKFLALELEFLTAVDGLHQADSKTRFCEGAIVTEARERSGVRLEYESMERKYTAALDELEFAFSPRGSNSNTISIQFDEIFETPVEIIAKTDNYLVENMDCLRERANIEALLSWLRINNTQDTALLKQLLENEDTSLASMLHQRIQMNAETSDILAEYKDCLHRIAKIFIDVNVVYREIDQIDAATDLDFKATATLRAETACRMRDLAKTMPTPITTTGTIEVAEEIPKPMCH